MGREVRMVPANWQHPKRADGRYQPMYDKSYKEACKEWIEEFIEWHVNGKPQSEICENYWEYAGNPPDEEYYRPHWEDAKRTHYMMYEDTTEGTPISPAFATPEELAHWLADTGASAFGGQTASYEAWLNIAKGGWAPSMVMDHGVMKSGVEFSLEQQSKGSNQLKDIKE